LIGELCPAVGHKKVNPIYDPNMSGVCILVIARSFLMRGHTDFF